MRDSFIDSVRHAPHSLRPNERRIGEWDAAGNHPTAGKHPFTPPGELASE